MSRIPCPTCDGPRRGDQNICGACVAALERALASVPALVDDLHVTLSRQTSRTGSGVRASVVPLPFDARASEAMWVLRNTLVGWVRVVMEGITTHAGPACLRCEHPSCGIARYSRGPADTLTSMARWLSVSLTRLVRHPAASEAHGEITEAVRAAQRVTDRAPERQFAGRCACGAALYAKPGASRVQCRDCDGDAVDVQTQRDAMLGALADQLMPAHQAADVLTRLAAPLPAATVRKWAERGRLLAHGYDAHGHSLYRVSDVRDLLVEKLQREQRTKEKRETKAEQNGRECERINA